MISSKTINILGVTGSVGRAAVDVVLANPDKFDVRVVSAHRDAEGLAEAAEKLGAERAVLTSADELVLDEEVDVTLCAIAGMAGLDSMMAVIECSKAVAIANKEPLVAAGDLVMAAAKEHGTILLPVDSEHNAIFQVFEGENRAAIERVILTASGGPFREWSKEAIEGATVEQALTHPNWVMGRKITVDSASMANKALEVIEAHYLFGMAADKIEVLVHPQSVVHSMVEYADGSVLAQMGASDMRTPIANALGWPERIDSGGEKLDLAAMARLDFEAPDGDKFPFLAMAYECIAAGAYACAAMNAANEVAVEAFLAGRIGFGDIYTVTRHCVEGAESCKLSDLKAVVAFDEGVRVQAEAYINQLSSQQRRVAP